MSENYKPGTVAKLTTPSGREHIVLRVGWPADDWISATEGGVYGATSVRPLVLLDLAEVGKGCNGESPDADQIVRALRDTCSVIACDIADQIEAQTRPPKPAEPTGLGAVVEDADGSLLVRVIDALKPWTCYGGPRWSWDEIDVVRVLSEGVEVDR